MGLNQLSFPAQKVSDVSPHVRKQVARALNTLPVGVRAWCVYVRPLAVDLLCFDPILPSSP